MNESLIAAGFTRDQTLFNEKCSRIYDKFINKSLYKKHFWENDLAWKGNSLRKRYGPRF